MTFSVVSQVSQVQIQYAKLIMEFTWYTASLETQNLSQRLSVFRAGQCSVSKCEHTDTIQNLNKRVK